MATIHTFEDIEAWKRARRLADELFNVSQRDVMHYDFALRDQLNRSTGSVMDNIAEGFERGGNRELVQFLYVSKGSAGETRSQLYRMLDRGYISSDEHYYFKEEVTSISQLLMNFAQYLKRSPLQGPKYH